MNLFPLFLALAPAAAPAPQDCNQNGIDDAIDLALGTSGDCDRDSVPDECQPCGFASVVLDFEGLAEGTPLDDEYVTLGVTFVPVGPDLLLPIVADESGPAVAFGTNDFSSDKPLVGKGGMADAIPVGGGHKDPVPIEMLFDPPVLSVAMRVFDVDDNEEVLIELFGAAGPPTTLLIAAGDPGTGDGVGKLAQLDAVAGSPAVSMRITSSDPDGTVDFAVDSLTLTRPDPSGCGRLVRVSQESSPGAADFDLNVLGVVHPFASAASAETLYAYDYPWKETYNGALIELIDGRSNLFLVESSEGLVLFVVHDRPSDGSGGTARVRVDVDDFTVAPDLLVGDDPGDAYTVNPANGTVTGAWSWMSCCTDGMAVGPLTGPWSATVRFELSFSGLDTWVAAGDGDADLPLALELNRRVRLELLAAPGSCAAPLTTDRVEHSLALGGVTSFALNAGAEHAGELYFVAGSASGTSPGLVLSGIAVPLQPDAYSIFTLSNANLPPFGTTLGLLDPLGNAAASITLPAGASPNLAGMTLHHAWISYSLTTDDFTAASNAVPLTFTP